MLDNSPASPTEGLRVPFFIRTGEHLPVTQTEPRLVFKHPPRLGFAAWPESAEPEAADLVRGSGGSHRS